MNTRPDRIAKAMEYLGVAQLNDAEQLRLAEKLIEDVFTRVCPMSDPQMCIAEGYMSSASHAVEQARLLVESWPHEHLPVDPDIDPENKRDPGPALCNTCGYALLEFGCSPSTCRRDETLAQVERSKDPRDLTEVMEISGQCRLTPQCIGSQFCPVHMEMYNRVASRTKMQPR
jgi:hypothetical protein